MSSLFKVFSFVGFMSLLGNAAAGTVSVGVNGGYGLADDNALTSDGMHFAQVYGQYQFDGGFGIEGGYNYFGGAEVNSVDVVDHGPFAAASLNADVGSNLQLSAKAGAMFSIQDGDAPNDHCISPFVGVGAQFAFSDAIYGRLGYDHYFKVNNNDVIDTDLDMFYAGLGLRY